MKMTFHSDPGHGWLEVDRAELASLGIADKITHYSYMRGDKAYLEEDCDFSTYMQARRDAGTPLTDSEIVTVNYNHDAPMRNYRSYTA